MSAQVVRNFYDAFQKKDFTTMQSLYAENATFSDPVFIGLNVQEVRAMWEMLISRGKDLQLTYQILAEKDNHIKTHWQATYTFSKTGRKVINNITADMVIENGLIVKHIDTFDFHLWAKQALGSIGFWLGWTSFLHKKVQKEARYNLNKFMQKR